MGKRAKRVAIGVAVALGSLPVLAFAVAAVAAFVVSPPLPREVRAALDARLAEFNAEAREVADRPTGDRRALERLADDESYRSIRGPEPWYERNRCPVFDEKVLAASDVTFRKSQPALDRFAAIVGDGLVVQGNIGRYDDDLFPISSSGIARRSAASAILDMRANRRERAMGRIEACLQAADGLLRTPENMSVVYGGYFEEETERALFFLIPRFTTAEITRLRSRLRALPDPRDALIRGYRSWIIWTAQLFDAYRSGAVSFTADTDCGCTATWKRPILDFLVVHTGWLKRIRYGYLNLAIRDHDLATAWLASGASGRYVSPGMSGRSQFPTLWYGPLESRIERGLTARVKKWRDAILKAFDLELARRGTPEGATWEMPFDEKTKLVRTPEYGCLVEVDSK